MRTLEIVLMKFWIRKCKSSANKKTDGATANFFLPVIPRYEGYLRRGRQGITYVEKSDTASVKKLCSRVVSECPKVGKP
jgi:hypothetical protein